MPATAACARARRAAPFSLRPLQCALICALLAMPGSAAAGEAMAATASPVQADPAALIGLAAVLIDDAPATVTRDDAGPREPALSDVRDARWRLAPVRWGGNMALDGRWSRGDDGSSNRQALGALTVDAASYLWQPWFVQMSAGLGLIVARGSSMNSGNVERMPDDNDAWTGRLGLQVFPGSRFPFELRADVSDSRTSTDFVGADYRSSRLSMSQSWRPARGADSYSLSYDSSTLSSEGRPDDSVRTLRGLMLNTLGSHTIELSGSGSINERGAGDSNRIDSFAARHGWRPGAALTVDNLATWNDIRVRNAAADVDLVSEIRQLSSFATWRPGDPARSTTLMTGSLRLVESSIASHGSDASRRGVDGAIGISHDLTPSLRAGASLSASRQSLSLGGSAGSDAALDDAERSISTQTATLSWTPTPRVFWKAAGETGSASEGWRWTPNVSASASAIQGTADGGRDTQALQLAHSFARSWLGDAHGVTSLTLMQSAGVLRDSVQAGLARTLAHSISVYRQFANGGATQSYLGLSVSDSRSDGPDGAASRFQLVNLQFTQRKQMSRDAGFSGSVTAQASRARVQSSLLTPVNTPLIDDRWNHYYSGSLQFDHQRVFGVPRLRFVALANAYSQPLDRRAEGDVDAPRDRISHLAELRLEYAIGRLETRLIARSAQVETRRVDALFFRINRRFGN